MAQVFTTITITLKWECLMFLVEDKYIHHLIFKFYSVIQCLSFQKYILLTTGYVRFVVFLVFLSSSILPVFCSHLPIHSIFVLEVKMYATIHQGSTMFVCAQFSYHKNFFFWHLWFTHILFVFWITCPPSFCKRMLCNIKVCKSTKFRFLEDEIIRLNTHRLYIPCAYNVQFSLKQPSTLFCNVRSCCHWFQRYSQVFFFSTSSSLPSFLKIDLIPSYICWSLPSRILS